MSVDYEFYLLKDTGYNLSYLPAGAHLIWETDDYLYYVSATDQKKLYKYTKSTGTDELITTRTEKIQAGNYDESNGKIYFADCDNDGVSDTFYVWYILVSNDNIISQGSFSHEFDSPLYVYDFIIGGSDRYLLVENIDDSTLEFYDVTSFPVVAPSGGTGRTSTGSYTIVIGNLIYFLADAYDVDDVYMYTWNLSTTTESELDGIQDYSLPSSYALRGLAYDGDDTILFILTKDADSKNYLCTYSISGDTITDTGIEYNVSLMLDRNVHGASGGPSEFEKGFDISNAYVYQIHRSYGYLLKIQGLDIAGTLVAITDNFLIDSNKNVYFLTNDIESLEVLRSEVMFDVPALLTLGTQDIFGTSVVINIFQNNAGTYSLCFQGPIETKEYEGSRRIYKCQSLTSELWNTKFTDSYTAQTAKAIMQDIIDNYCDYGYRDSSIDANGDFTDTYTLDIKNKTPAEVFDVLMDYEDGEWFIEPDGKIYAYAISQIPSTGKTVTQSSANIVSDVKIKEIVLQFNQITLYGAISSGARLKTDHDSGYGVDLESQKIHGIHEFVDFFAHVNSQAGIDALSDAILERTGISNNPIYIKVVLEGLKFQQYGKTINFQFTPFDELASADDYYLLEVTYDFLQDYLSVKMSSGLIQEGRNQLSEYKKSSTSDEEWIDQVAELVSAGGETNTASNVGTDGEGVYDGKVGVDLQFRHIAPGSNKVTVTLDAGDNDIDLDVAEGNIDHDALTNFAENEHRVWENSIAQDVHADNIPEGAVTQHEAALSITESQISDLGSYLENLVEDTTPQLGGDLDLNSHGIDFPTTPNITDCIDDDTMATASATVLATAESIKEFIESQNHAVWHDGGDDGSWDYTKGDAPLDVPDDTTWRDLDLSGIVGSNVALVLLRIVIEDNVAESYVDFRLNGNSGNYNTNKFSTQVANIRFDNNCWVLTDSNGVCEVRTNPKSNDKTTLNIQIFGWFTFE